MDKIKEDFKECKCRSAKLFNMQMKFLAYIVLKNSIILHSFLLLHVSAMTEEESE